MQRKLVLYYAPDAVNTGDREEIATLFTGWEIAYCAEKRDLEHTLQDAEVAVGRIPMDLLLPLPHLKWYQHMGAGVDFLWQYPEFESLPFIISNVSGSQGQCISEHILALLFSLTRGLNLAWQQKQQHLWKPLPMNSIYSIHGKRVLLCGYGGIGAVVARHLHTLGAIVDVVRARPGNDTPYADKVGTLTDLDLFLRPADIIILTCQLTRQTEYMIQAAQFACMKPNAILINIARGRLIRERDLVDALQRGLIAGAGLDVFEEEPLPVDSPLWNMDNVVITPHCAADAPDHNDKDFVMFLENARAYSRGEAPTTIIHASRGYSASDYSNKQARKKRPRSAEAKRGLYDSDLDH